MNGEEGQQGFSTREELPCVGLHLRLRRLEIDLREYGSAKPVASRLTRDSPTSWSVARDSCIPWLRASSLT